MEASGPSDGNPADRPSGSGDDGREDRRANGRLVPPAPIAARVRGLHFARILNISRRGALAETATVVRPLERNELLIHFPDGPFVTQATVQRCRAWRQAMDPKGERILFFRTGLEFDSLSLFELEALERNLVLMDAETSAEHRATGTSSPARSWLLVDRGPATRVDPEDG